MICWMSDSDSRIPTRSETLSFAVLTTLISVTVFFDKQSQKHNFFQKTFILNCISEKKEILTRNCCETSICVYTAPFIIDLGIFSRPNSLETHLPVVIMLLCKSQAWIPLYPPVQTWEMWLVSWDQTDAVNPHCSSSSWENYNISWLRWSSSLHFVDFLFGREIKRNRKFIQTKMKELCFNVVTGFGGTVNMPNAVSVGYGNKK